jgi:hypothetical protein
MLPAHRFKLMNFEGCTTKWKSDAERYLAVAYDNDWSPRAVCAKEAEVDRLNVTAKPSEPAFKVKEARKPTSGFTAFSAFVAANGGQHDDVMDDEPVVPLITEVDKYLQLPALPHSRNGRDTCPLEWWKIHAPQLPHLAKMARQFLALPASSAGCERLFSAAGRMHDDFKKVTSEDTIGMQLEVKVNVP